MGNPNARGKIGNVGGGRKGYEWEEDQKKQMKKHLNWFFAYIDAVRKGKNTERMDKQFEKLERVLLKIMDKLHANKTDLTSGGETIKQIPIYATKSLQNDDSDNQDIQSEKED